MGTTERESRKDRVNPAQRYIRIQTVGMAFFLSSPVAGILADMYGLSVTVPQIMFLIAYIGVIIFAIGYVGRQELRTRELKGSEDKNG